ncbi:MAG: hypothetical protein ACE5G0_04735 [Rhodothermales bacterium]
MSFRSATVLLFLSATLAWGFPACTPRNDNESLEPTLRSIQRNVFSVHCALSGCHAGSTPESQLNLETGNAYANLVSAPSIGFPDLLRVDPGHAERSYLIRKLKGIEIVGERMPLGKAALPDSIIHVIRDWIDAGAPGE